MNGQAEKVRVQFSLDLFRKGKGVVLVGHAQLEKEKSAMLIVCFFVCLFVVSGGSMFKKAERVPYSVG